MRARSSSMLANSKSCNSLIPLSITSTGCILCMGLFRRSNATSSSWYLGFLYRRCRFARTSTGGVVLNTLVARPLLSEWKVGSMKYSKKIFRTIFRFLKVYHFSFLTSHLFSSVLCSVSVIAIAGIS